MQPHFSSTPPIVVKVGNGASIRLTFANGTSKVVLGQGETVEILTEKAPGSTATFMAFDVEPNSRVHITAPDGSMLILDDAGEVVA